MKIKGKNNLKGVLSYRKLLLLRDLKNKYEPKPINKTYIIKNDTPTMPAEEIAGEIHYRLQKSQYSVKNIEKAIDMLSQAKQGMITYDKYIDEIKKIIVDSKKFDNNTIKQKLESWKTNLKNLVDTTRIKYIRLLTTEDYVKDIEFRKKVRTRADFRKRFDPKLNPALIYNKIIIHTAIPEEPFVQINIPVELGYKTYKLDEIDISDNDSKLEFIQKFEELDKLVENEIDNSESYIHKLNNIRKKIEIYNENLNSTIKTNNLNNVKAVLNKNKIKEDKLNFGIVTNKTNKGVVLNFSA